jgi:hypothetical protein
MANTQQFSNVRSRRAKLLQAYHTPRELSGAMLQRPRAGGRIINLQRFYSIMIFLAGGQYERNGPVARAFAVVSRF